MADPESPEVTVLLIDWQQRAQFFAISAQMMRQEQSIVALDLALEEFAKVAPRQAKVVELRYFGGLSEERSAP
jgi:hypothetical protein